MLSKIDRPQHVLLEELCFHAQQAPEKALKAVLLFKKVSFPRTHSVRMLLDLLPPGITIPENIQDAAALTEYAVQARYPGDYEDITREEYKEAIILGEAVFNWAVRITSEQPQQ